MTEAGVSALATFDRDGGASLVDLLDRLLETGVFVRGDVVISLAGIDLVHLDLRLLLTAVEAALERAGR